MTTRILISLVVVSLMAVPAFAQTATKPAATAADDEEPSSFEQNKACNVKWKAEKEKTGAKGYKPYYTFMAKCM